jgi:LuxR family transcriptional regulator, maltose regulon positive regulatory protein
MSSSVTSGRYGVHLIAPGSVILRVKVARPLPRPEHIARPRLLDQLRAGVRGRLTLLAAPLGFGKTTLLAEWAAEDSRAVAWLSLDDGDNDPARFLAYLTAAIRTVAPQVGERVLAVQPIPVARLQDLMLPLLVNDLNDLPERVVLVLDNYHVVSDAAVHDVVSYLVENLPQRVRLVVSTRVDPRLPLARLRAQGDLTELRADAFRFTASEAATFLARQLGPVLAPEDVRRLQARTDGWPAALYLAALSLRGRGDLAEAVESFAADDRNVGDYLRAELLGRQEVGLRRFLIHTSILSQLCAPLCDAVTDRDDGMGSLAELERDNLLLPLDSRRVWFRYHPMLADLLQRELQRTEPDMVPRLHQRASRWYRNEGMVVEAAHHATAGGDTDAAIELVGRHWSQFLDQGQLATVSRWLEALPADAIAGNQTLCFAAAMVASHTGNVDAAERWLDAAEQAPAAGAMSSMDLPATALRAWLRLLRGDIDGAIAVARRAQAGPPLVDAAQAVAPLLPLGAALWWSQQFAEAIVVLQSAARTALNAGLDAQAIFAVGFQAAAALDDGDATRAQVLAGEALELIRRASAAAHPFSAMARVVAGLIQARRGELELATEQIELGVRLADLAGAWHISAYGLLALAEVRQLDRAPAAARRLLARAQAVLENLPEDAGTVRVSQAAVRLRLRASGGGDRVRSQRLSERELTVLRRLTGRQTQGEIAADLHVSRNTVKTQVRSLFDKLGVTSRAEAVARARELGLL